MSIWWLLSCILAAGVNSEILSQTTIKFNRGVMEQLPPDPSPPAPIDPSLPGFRRFYEIQKDGKLTEHMVGDYKKPVPEIGLLTHAEVIGVDTRIQVQQEFVYPWSAFGRLEIGCTGTFIGPRHILTAAHCVNTRGWNYDLDLQTHNANGDVLETLTWHSAYVPGDWVDSKKLNNDMALIVLEEDTVSDVWLPIQPTNFTIAPLVGVAGYPSDKPGQLWFSSGKIYPQPEGWVYHDADTKSGNSGSTMWFAKNGLSVVQHVHNGYIALSGLNYGTSITADRYEWLCFLMKQTSAGVDICSLPPAGRDKST